MSAEPCYCFPLIRSCFAYLIDRAPVVFKTCQFPVRSDVYHGGITVKKIVAITSRTTDATTTRIPLSGLCACLPLVTIAVPPSAVSRVNYPILPRFTLVNGMFARFRGVVCWLV